ncbi:MAG: DMT family transporter [Acidobacteria bacterium]|nr:DMT family transporter [Acidobacteriota bacterium]
MLKFLLLSMTTPTRQPNLPETQPRQHWLADGSLLLITFIWGFSFVIVKQVLQQLPASYFNALRFTAASATFVPFTARQWRNWRPVVAPGLLMSLFLYAGFLFQATGLRHTTPSKSAFITSSSVIGVPIILRIFYKRKSDRSALAGVVLGFAGLYFLTLPANYPHFDIGDGLTGLCAIAWAFHIVLAGQFSRRYPTLALASIQIGTTCLGFWITAWLLGEIAPVPITVVPAVLYGGMLATSLCFALQLWAQRHISSTRAGLWLTTEPLFAAATSYLWIGERLTGPQILGALLIVAGVVLAEAGYQWDVLNRWGSDP